MKVTNVFSKVQGGRNVVRLSKCAIALYAATLVVATANAAASYSTEDEGATLVVTVDADGATLDAS